MADWERVRLGEVLTSVSRSVDINAGQSYRTIGVRWWGGGAYERQTIDGSQTAAKTLSIVCKDDLIINKIWVRHGSTAIAGAEVDGCVASNEFPTFEVDRELVLPEWLHWLTKTQDFWAECAALSQGTSGKNRIKPAQFLTIEIPLPPLPEQQRIVTRVKGLMEKVQKTHGLHQEAQTQHRALANSLTSELFESQGRAEMLAVQDLCDVRGGIQKSSARTAGANPKRYLTVAHVQRNKILTTDPRFFEVTDEELERWRLLPGDVLVIEGNGSADQIGRSALFEGEIENCVHQNHVIRVRPNSAQLLPKYLNAYFNSPIGRQQMLELSRTTSGLFNLSVGRIKDISLPVPSIDEQLAFLRRLENIRSRLDDVERLQMDVYPQLNALPASILARAFAGAL